MDGKRSILVVDSARGVRMALARHLRDRFRVCEAEDAESAWQCLLQDNAVVAVISGELPLAAGAESLLLRMRSHAQQRLRALPFLLIVPEDDVRLASPAPGRRGEISGFVCATMAAAGILGRLQALLANPLPHRLLSGEALQRHMSSALAAAAENGSNVCALVFGIDKCETLAHEFGSQAAAQIGARLADLLHDKIGSADAIGHYADDCLAIVSCGTELEQCAHFARRVCASLAFGQIAIHGHQLQVTASAGVASAQADHPRNGEALLALAESRLRQAWQSGGHSVLAQTALAASGKERSMPGAAVPPASLAGTAAGTEPIPVATGEDEKKSLDPLLWSAAMETGIEIIDGQHRRIVDYINALGGAARAPGAATVGEVDAVLAQLADYTFSHFAFEESLLAEAGYPLLQPHRAIHAQFMKRLAKYRERHGAGEDIAAQLHDLLCTWLVHHIQRDDMAYVADLHARLPGMFQDKSAQGWIDRALARFFR